MLMGKVTRLCEIRTRGGVVGIKEQVSVVKEASNTEQQQQQRPSRCVVPLPLLLLHWPHAHSASPPLSLFFFSRAKAKRPKDNTIIRVDFPHSARSSAWWWCRGAGAVAAEQVPSKGGVQGAKHSLKEFETAAGQPGV